jgi:hypothetical protein
VIYARARIESSKDICYSKNEMPGKRMRSDTAVAFTIGWMQRGGFCSLLDEFSF